MGCRFSEAIRHHQLFYPNPDRRNRQHNSVNGIYAPGCGLHEVNFSWSGAEYLYLVLFLNNTLLPPEALFCIRYQKFDCLFEGAYRHLLSEEVRQAVRGRAVNNPLPLGSDVCMTAVGPLQDTLWVKWLQALREAAVFIPDEAIMQRIRDQDDRRKMCDYYQVLPGPLVHSPLVLLPSMCLATSKEAQPLLPTHALGPERRRGVRPGQRSPGVTTAPHAAPQGLIEKYIGNRPLCW